MGKMQKWKILFSFKCLAFVNCLYVISLIIEWKNGRNEKSVEIKFIIIRNSNL